MRSVSTFRWLSVLGLVGIAGIQRFYLGQGIRGFLMLITLGWFFIGTLADLIGAGSIVGRENARQFR